MIKRLLPSLLLALLLVDFAAARKPMVPTGGKYELTGRDVSMIRPAAGKGQSQDPVQKKNVLHWDEKNGRYSYRYWRENGQPVDFFYEPTNQVAAFISCKIQQLHHDGLYEYTYNIQNLRESRQRIQVAAIDLKPGEVAGSSLSRGGWIFFNAEQLDSRWAFFGGRERPLVPGEDLIIVLKCRRGPVPTYCYLQGKRNLEYRSPQDDPSSFGDSPPDIEGVKGLTLAPGAWPAGEPERLRLLNTFLKQAVEWGWIAEPAGRALQGLAAREPSPGRLAKALAAAARKFQAQKQAEPEVVYFLDHAEQVLATPPVRPGK